MRLAGLKEKSLDAICVQTQSGGCGSWIDILPRILLRFGMDEAIAISSKQDRYRYSSGGMAAIIKAGPSYGVGDCGC